MTSGLAIDVGTYGLAAAVVSTQGSWLVTDPATGEARWRMGAGRSRPIERVAELLSAVRREAQREHGPVSRVLLTIPAEYSPRDPHRARLIEAAEAVGFATVELLTEAVAAVWAPPPVGRPVSQPGDLVLVYDLGVRFVATLVRIGVDGHDVVGYQSIVDRDAAESAALVPPPIEHTIACCHDLLARLAVSPSDLRAVLPVGAGARTAGLELTLQRAIGAPLWRAEEPELAVVLGAAHWLPRSGERVIAAQPASVRMMPLTFPIPDGSARLVRWLVGRHEPYPEGAALARVRLMGGSMWELTARSGGVLDTVLVAEGASVGAGDWVALARST